MEERLQKFLSRAGVASRRHAEAMIVDGRVKVNGKVITVLGTRIEPQKDLVLLDGKLVSANTERKYFLFYKPPGVVTTMSDPEGRPTVADYAVDTGGRVFPVGRLDYDAEGALLLTDDGDLANKLMHPSHQVPRVYLAKVKGVPDEPSLQKLVEGVRLEDGMARAVEARIFEKAQRNTWVKIVVTEGRQHLVKRLCAAIGHPVVRLYRPAHAGLPVQGLMPGALRALTNDEIRRVKAAADGDAQPEPRLSLPARRHGHAAPGFEPEQDDEPEPTRPEGRRLVAPPEHEQEEAREEVVPLAAPPALAEEAEGGEWQPRSRRRSTRGKALDEAPEQAPRAAPAARAGSGAPEGRRERPQVSRFTQRPEGGGNRFGGERDAGGKFGERGGGKRFGGERDAGGKFGERGGDKRFGSEREEGRKFEPRGGATRFGGDPASKSSAPGAESRGPKFGERSGGKRFGASSGGKFGERSGGDRDAGGKFGERGGGKRFGASAGGKFGERSGGDRDAGRKFGERSGGDRDAGGKFGERSGGKRFGASGGKFGERSGGKRFGASGGKFGERSGGDRDAGGKFGERSGGKRFGASGGKFGERSGGKRGHGAGDRSSPRSASSEERPFGAPQRTSSGGRLDGPSGERSFGARPGPKRFSPDGGRPPRRAGQRPLKKSARPGGFKGEGRNSPRKPRGSW